MNFSAPILSLSFFKLYNLYNDEEISCIVCKTASYGVVEPLSNDCENVTTVKFVCFNI